jgi:hypothetical protein
LFGSRRALLNKVMKGVPLTFSRASVAYNNGVSVPANIPRFQTVDGKTGILIEEGTTNLLTANQSKPSTLTGVTSNRGGVPSIISDNNYGTVLHVETPGTQIYEGINMACTGSNGLFYSGQAKIRAPLGIVISLKIGGVTLSEGTITGKGMGDNDWIDIKNVVVTADQSSLAFYVRTLNQVATQFDVTFMQLEQKAYSTSFILGGTSRLAEGLIIPGILAYQQFTIEFEVYIPVGFGNRTSYPGLFTTGNEGMRMYKVNTAGSTRMNMNGTMSYFDTGFSLTEGAWNKVAIAGDATSLRTYFNGSYYFGSKDDPIYPTNDADKSLKLGHNSGLFVNGIFRNVCISTKLKRTVTEIQARAQANTYPIDSKVTAFTLLETDIRGVASA